MESVVKFQHKRKQGLTPICCMTSVCIYYCLQCLMSGTAYQPVIFSLTVDGPTLLLCHLIG